MVQISHNAIRTPASSARKWQAGKLDLKICCHFWKHLRFRRADRWSVFVI